MQPRAPFTDLQELFVRISTPRAVGCGVLLGPKHVLTCRHVLQMATGYGANDERHYGEPLTVRRFAADGRSFADPVTATAMRSKVLPSRPVSPETRSADEVAVLELDDELPIVRDGPFWAEGGYGHAFFAYGFPATFPSGIPTEGRIRAPDASGYVTAICNPGDPEVAPGFSGSPALDINQSAVCGIVRDRVEIKSKVICRLIPVDVIVDVLRREFAAAFAASTYFKQALPAGDADLPQYLASILQKGAVDPFYLPLELREHGSPLRQAAKPGTAAIRTAFISNVRRVVASSVESIRLDAAALAATNRSETVTEPVDQLKAAVKPVIVLGDPGTGKTFLLRRLETQLAEMAGAPLPRDAGGKAEPRIPLFVSCGRIGRSRAPQTFPELRELLFSQVEVRFRPLLNERFDRGGVTVIVDALDELPRSEYEPMMTLLSQFAAGERGRNNFVFSCRINDFSPTLEAETLILLPLSLNVVQGFFEREIEQGNIPLDVLQTDRARLLDELLSHEMFGSWQYRTPLSVWAWYRMLLQGRKLENHHTDLYEFLFRASYDKYEVECARLGLPCIAEVEIRGEMATFAEALISNDLGRSASQSDLASISYRPEEDRFGAAVDLGVLRHAYESEERFEFSDQRTLEFFAGQWFAAQDQDQVDWPRYFKSMIWYEPLLHFLGVQMKAAGDIGGFLEAVQEYLHETCAGDPPADFLVQFHELDFIQFCVRVELRLRRSPRYTKDLHNRLLEALPRLRKWSPLAHYRMIVLMKMDDSLVSSETVTVALDSSVKWVREQAVQSLAETSQLRSDGLRSLGALAAALGVRSGAFRACLPLWLRTRRTDNSVGRRVLSFSIAIFALFLLLQIVVAGATLGLLFDQMSMPEMLMLGAGVVAIVAICVLWQEVYIHTLGGLAAAWIVASWVLLNWYHYGEYRFSFDAVFPSLAVYAASLLLAFALTLLSATTASWLAVAGLRLMVRGDRRILSFRNTSSAEPLPENGVIIALIAGMVGVAIVGASYIVEFGPGWIAWTLEWLGFSVTPASVAAFFGLILGTFGILVWVFPVIGIFAEARGKGARGLLRALGQLAGFGVAGVLGVGFVWLVIAAFNWLMSQLTTYQAEAAIGAALAVALTMASLVVVILVRRREMRLRLAEVDHASLEAAKAIFEQEKRTIVRLRVLDRISNLMQAADPATLEAELKWLEPKCSEGALSAAYWKMVEANLSRRRRG